MFSHVIYWYRNDKIYWLYGTFIWVNNLQPCPVAHGMDDEFQLNISVFLLCSVALKKTLYKQKVYIFFVLDFQNCSFPDRWYPIQKKIDGSPLCKYFSKWSQKTQEHDWRFFFLHSVSPFFVLIPSLTLVHIYFICTHNKTFLIQTQIVL